MNNRLFCVVLTLITLVVLSGCCETTIEINTPPRIVVDTVRGDEPIETLVYEFPEETTAQTEAETTQSPIYLGRYKLTAYCSCVKCCGSGGSRTATGTTPKQGRTIAVDPKVIPYGTSVYIEGYGTYIAEDTGGAIKSNRIDVYFSDHTSALNFGVRYADVYLED